MYVFVLSFVYYNLFLLYNCLLSRLDLSRSDLIVMDVYLRFERLKINKYFFKVRRTGVLAALVRMVNSTGEAQNVLQDLEAMKMRYELLVCSWVWLVIKLSMWCGLRV